MGNCAHYRVRQPVLSAQRVPSSLGGEVSATSFFDVIFDVTATVPFDLDVLGAPGFPGASLSLVFTGPGGTIAEVDDVNFFASVDGVLTPGQYRIVAEADVFSVDPFVVTQTNVDFALPVHAAKSTLHRLRQGGGIDRKAARQSSTRVESSAGRSAATARTRPSPLESGRAGRR